MASIYPMKFLSGMLTGGLCILTACTPVKATIENQYKITSYSTIKAPERSNKSILVSQSDAIAGYQTEQMLYTQTRYRLDAFANNSWISPPAAMLTPLIVQSLQHSHYFYAVAAGPNADKTDYRLDTQLIQLQQNFLTKPSSLEFTAQVVLTRVSDNRVMASKTFLEKIPCPADTPYGGVIATNNAVKAFTARVTRYVIQELSHQNAEPIH